MTMLALLGEPAERAISSAGTPMTSTPSGTEWTVWISELLKTSSPPGRSLGANLLSDALLQITSEFGALTTGQAIGRFETTTMQLAVPPRTSAPYEAM